MRCILTFLAYSVFVLPTGNWMMTFGASYNPTEIKDPNLTVAACGGGCTMLDPVVNGLAYIDGTPCPTPPTSFSTASSTPPWA